MAGEDDWSTAAADVYYCGTWDDGAMKTGWQKIYVHDSLEEEDMEHWFYFNSNGKRFYNNTSENTKEKKINGKKYGFDSRGVMTYEWTLATNANGGRTTSANWRYFNSPEDGARVTKGWFKVIAPTEDNSFGKVISGSATASNTFDAGNADDETEKWYYADGNGKLEAGTIEKIKGKYYAFHPSKSYMLSGLVFMATDGRGNIVDVFDDGVDSDELDDIISGSSNDANIARGLADARASLYYFGSDADTDGAMKTGSTTITVDGDSYNFFFTKSGGTDSKGKGVSGIDDNKYIYKYGMKIKAGTDDKYKAVAVTGSVDTGANASGTVVSKLDSADFRTSVFVQNDYTNNDDETVRYINGANIATLESEASADIYLVNTTGTIVKDKTAAKDGDDWYFYVDGKRIKLYANSKNLNPQKLNGTNTNAPYDLTKWEDSAFYTTYSH